MLYRLFKPTPELADIVSAYWYAPIEANSFSKQQYNTPLFEGLIFNFTNLKETRHYEGESVYLTKTAYIQGQITSKCIISGSHEDGGYIIGVRFKPLGLLKITGINMIHLVNKLIDAEDIWGNELEWLTEEMQNANSIEATFQVLEDFFIKKKRKVRLNFRLKNVAQAIALMQNRKGNITSKELQYLTNTSRKTLERTFMNFHGLNPKVYNRIIRFNVAIRFMDLRQNLNLTKLAYKLGYFDQSHFIKDFKIFSGQTPTEYLKTVEAERRKHTMPVD